MTHKPTDKPFGNTYLSVNTSDKLISRSETSFYKDLKKDEFFLLTLVWLFRRVNCA